MRAEDREPEKKQDEPATASPLLVIGKDTLDNAGMAKEERDTVVPRASLEIPVRMNTVKGWLAPVYINDVYLLMTADTGAAVTMLNTAVFRRYFPNTKFGNEYG